MTDSGAAMNRTLTAMGMGGATVRQRDWKVIAEAPPHNRDMAVTYQCVNDHLASRLKRRSLTVHHITGEARALVDPAHRQVLRGACARGETSAIACSFESSDAPSAWDFVAHQHKHWGRFEWFDLIDILALAAHPVVRIYRLPEPEDVHFSIFGDRLVLLQEPHHHPTEEKWVWFLESRALAAALRPRLEQLFARAVPIEPAEFDEILDWLHEYETFEALAELVEGSGADQGAIDADPAADLPARAVDGAASDVTTVGRDRGATCTRLVALGFVEPGGLALTARGRAWFASFTSDERG
jgi:hypothetical protein